MTKRTRMSGYGLRDKNGKLHSKNPKAVSGKIYPRLKFEQKLFTFRSTGVFSHKKSICVSCRKQVATNDNVTCVECGKQIQYICHQIRVPRKNASNHKWKKFMKRFNIEDTSK